DTADGARLGAHDEGFGGGAAGVVVDALEELAVRDAGGGEEGVVGGAEIVGGEDLLEVVALVDGGLALLVVPGPQPALHLAAHALQGGGGDDAFGRAADAEEDVGARLRPRRGDGAGDVAVGDQPDAGPGGSDLADQVFVPITVEDDGGDVAHVAAQRLGHGLQ